MQAMRLQLQSLHVAHVSTFRGVADTQHQTHVWSHRYAAAVQMTTAFGEQGLLSHDHKMVYADTGRLAKVTAPALFLVGDRDRMCPPEGCRRTYQVGHCARKGFHGLGFCGTPKPKTLR
jgi:pimeloyl-ACP methyl ester carboxylesterase